ncbi:hypothetical protein JCM19992_07470 [Thermostilla marina]
MAGLNGDEIRTTRRRFPGGESAALVVCETTGRWTAAFRTALARLEKTVDTPRDIMTLPGREMLDEVLQRRPTSAVVIEWAGNSKREFVVELARLRRRFPAVLWIAVGEGLATFHVPVREAGAHLVVYRPLDVLPVARAVLRRLDRFAAADQSCREAIWRRLPWPAFAVKREICDLPGGEH